MAEREGGGSSPWVAFLAGIILVAIVAIGIVAYGGGFDRQQDTAQLEMNMPDVKVNPPDIDLPEPPSVPTAPPSGDQAPVEAPATP
jgi:ABC-type lipoprotein release transport system permease subunit